MEGGELQGCRAGPEYLTAFTAAYGSRAARVDVDQTLALSNWGALADGPSSQGGLT
jgi:hypothetical protein